MQSSEKWAPRKGGNILQRKSPCPGSKVGSHRASAISPLGAAKKPKTSDVNDP